MSQLPSPQPFLKERLLLVEGKTPFAFFGAILKHLNLSDVIDIRNFGGVSEFRKYTSGLRIAADFRRVVKTIGVIRDAEDSYEGAIHSVQAAVKDAKLDEGHTWKYFILPDNSSPGMLETLCWQSIQDQKKLNCVNGFLECCEKSGAVTWPKGHHSHKARIQTYLATFPDKLQIFPGTAAMAGIWDWNAEAFAPVIDFIQTL